MFLHAWGYSDGLCYNIYDFFYVFIYNEYYELNLYMYYFGIIYSEVSPTLKDVESFFERFDFFKNYPIEANYFYCFVYANETPESFHALPKEPFGCSLFSLVNFVF